MRVGQGVKAFYRNYEKIPQNGRLAFVRSSLIPTNVLRIGKGVCQ